MIEFKNVGASYGKKKALDGVSIAAENGELTPDLLTDADFFTSVILLIVISSIVTPILLKRVYQN